MKLLTLLLSFPVFALCQTTFVLPKDVQTKGYSLAIGEYIKTMKAKDKTSFDTVFLGKHEDFPDITLPAEIENTKIVILTNAEAEKKYASRKSIIFINMIDDFTKDVCLFKLIVFKTEKLPEKINWWPIYNFNVSYYYDLNTKLFKLKTSKFEYSYSNKFTSKQ